ncbi:MAG TPA: transglycosylase domain-containing protein [Candidatus Sulfomarinibacteraceae bacterium]|nr:transglycosylase domain-containing protein [Candidatus Sulfomarinibacteraceae bacterium]
MRSEHPTQPVIYRVQQDGDSRRKRGCGGCLGKVFLASLLLIALFIFSGVAVAATLVYVQLSAEIDEGIIALDQARERETFETTRILDRDGQLLWEIFGEGKRTKVPLDRIPLQLQQATIAVEDDTFYENIGLDAPSLAAALIYNLRNPEGRPVGGSTITQQIVRHIAFGYEERTAVSYSRKTREIILAWLMNRQYEKDEILELYLNEIYYGNLAYGIEAAAQTYFGKSAAELSLAESSLLAALPQSPVELDPFTNLDGARQRQWLVLNLMVEEGFITRDEAEAAYLQELTFAPQEVSLAAPHFAVYVRQLLEEQFGAEMVANGGLRVTTTLDLDFQTLAERLAREHVDRVGPEHNLTNASLVALKPGTGEILAMLGSVDYRDTDIDGNVNIALTPQQPGSAIKPVTYAAALSPGEDGSDPPWTLGDILWDVSVDYPQPDGSIYSPVNYSRTFHGPQRPRQALANSYNVPAVLVLQDIGVPRFLEFARRLGITSLSQDPSQYGLSLTLGGGEVTPLELAGAYAVFANGGNLVAPASILRVETAAGELLYEYEPPAPAQVLDPRVAFLISDILDDDAARAPAMGQDNPLALPFPAAAKTGTTNDFRDNWTVGYTPGLVVGVWTGNTDNSEMIDISGLTGAAPLWSDYMQAVSGDEALRAILNVNGAPPPGEFTAPPGLEQQPLCDLQSVTPGASDCNRNRSEWFLVDETPQAPTPPPSEPRVIWEQLDPAVWRLAAVPLPDDLDEEIQIDTGDDEMPPPVACYVEQGVLMEQLPDEAETAVFLAPPRNEESMRGAYRWAQEHGLAIMPRLACSEELLAVSGREEGEVAFFRIRSPEEGDTVGGIVPITGTADFDTELVQFYKIEIGAGENPQEWTTIGETHDTPVVNGELETLVAAAFDPGVYTLRLVVVLWDGNYAGEPDAVTFAIE